MVQWLRLHAAHTEDPGLVRGQGTRSHMPQLRSDTVKWINKSFLIFKKSKQVSTEDSDPFLNWANFLCKGP